jgi:hydrogenase expression/formation protein HypC
MCLAVPGRILAVDGNSARVDFTGVERMVHVDLLPDLQVGEYVLVHAGFAIQRLESSEAAEIFRQLEEAAALMEANERKPE